MIQAVLPWRDRSPAVAFGRQSVLFSGRPPLATKADTAVLQFAGAAKPRFIAPMVIENVPELDPSKPETVKLYAELMKKAQTFARTQVSGWNVGEILIGNSGRAYLGCNVEIKGADPATTIHGEAFAYALAREWGETGIKQIVTPPVPCGSCRQLLMEAGNPDLLVSTINIDEGTHDKTRPLKEWFPDMFNSSGANLDKNMFKAPALALPPRHYKDPLTQQAYDDATKCYIPKQKRRTWGSIGVELKDGRVITGQALTTSGPNPTITPVQNLLIKLIANEIPYDQIQRAVVVEPEAPDYSFYWQTAGIINNIAPGAKLKRVQVAYTPAEG